MSGKRQIEEPQAEVTALHFVARRMGLGFWLGLTWIGFGVVMTVTAPRITLERCESPKVAYRDALMLANPYKIGVSGRL